MHPGTNLLSRKAVCRFEEHTFFSPFTGFIMDFVQTRAARRKRASELSARKERKIIVFCSGIAVLMFMLAASAFLLRWFTESPPLMPH
jgi:hypothetical protein